MHLDTIIALYEPFNSTATGRVYQTSRQVQDQSLRRVRQIRQNNRSEIQTELLRRTHEKSWLVEPASFPSNHGKQQAVCAKRSHGTPRRKRPKPACIRHQSILSST